MGRLLKQCNDGRFQRVEERLLKSLEHFLKHDTIASAGIADITSYAKTWKSTFYDHFKDKDDAISRFNHKYDKALKRLLGEITDRHIDLEAGIIRLLYFISRHKGYYSVCLHRQNLVPFSMIVKIFRPVLTQSWSNYGHRQYDLCFRILCGEIFGVIHFWGNSEQFDRTKIKSHAIYLSRLARNTTRRLS